MNPQCVLNERNPSQGRMSDSSKERIMKCLAYNSDVGSKVTEIGSGQQDLCKKGFIFSSIRSIKDD